MAADGLLPLPLPANLWKQIAKEFKFSPQQLRVVELILRNATDKQIATAINRGEPTIRSHLRRVFDRLELKDRGDLVHLVFARSHNVPR